MRQIPQAPVEAGPDASRVAASDTPPPVTVARSDWREADSMDRRKRAQARNIGSLIDLNVENTMRGVADMILLQCSGDRAAADTRAMS